MPDKLRRRRERLAQASSGDAAEPKAKAAKRSKGRGKKVSREAKTLFTRQMATLLDAGLPVVRSLKVLEAQMAPGPLKDVVGEISEDVEGGSTISESIGKHPGVFDDLYVNMVRAGEASGALVQIFNRLSEFMEKAEALVRKVKGAMIYPVIVTIVAVAILTFVMLFVVPNFERAFADMDMEMPAMTRALIGTSHAVGAYWWLILAVLALLWFGAKAYGRTSGGRRFFDRMKLRLPLFGGINRDTQVVRFSRTLGTLSSSGVPLLSALDIVGDASGNVIVSDGVDQLRAAVEEGETLARPMAETGLFDDMTVNMVDVGEETGELDRMLMRIADNHEVSVDAKVAALAAALEPALIVVMAVIVGFIVVALFVPLLRLQQSMAGS